jgi:hypothetical protein
LLPKELAEPSVKEPQVLRRIQANPFKEASSNLDDIPQAAGQVAYIFHRSGPEDSPAQVAIAFQQGQGLMDKCLEVIQGEGTAKQGDQPKALTEKGMGKIMAGGAGLYPGPLGMEPSIQTPGDLGGIILPDPEFILQSRSVPEVKHSSQEASFGCGGQMVQQGWGENQVALPAGLLQIFANIFPLGWIFLLKVQEFSDGGIPELPGASRTGGYD